MPKRNISVVDNNTTYDAVLIQSRKSSRRDFIAVKQTGINRILKCGLCTTEYTVIFWLLSQYNPPADKFPSIVIGNQEKLAHRLGITRSPLWKAFKSLEEKGLIRKYYDEDGRITVDISENLVY